MLRDFFSSLFTPWDPPSPAPPNPQSNHVSAPTHIESIINCSRRKRIALGSGTTLQEVNNLLRQHTQMSKTFKAMGGGGGAKMQHRLMSQMGGGQWFGR
jgi:hypothetical protein